jgi:hypothetical protein
VRRELQVSDMGDSKLPSVGFFRSSCFSLFMDDNLATAGTDRVVQYRVTSIAGTLSLQALSSSITIPARPNPPTKLSVTATGQPAATLRTTFTVANTAMGYEIRRSTDSKLFRNSLPPATRSFCCFVWLV